MIQLRALLYTEGTKMYVGNLTMYNICILRLLPNKNLDRGELDPLRKTVRSHTIIRVEQNGE